MAAPSKEVSIPSDSIFHALLCRFGHVANATADFKKNSILERLITFVRCLPERSENSASQSLTDTNFAGDQLKLRLLSTCLGLAVSLTVSYFGFKLLANVLDPTRVEKQDAQKRADALLRRIGIVNPTFKLTEYEMCIACNLVHEMDIETSWCDIGGLEETIEEIRQTVILPFKHHVLFSGSRLLQPPKGVLLYGPPGCGKTLIAKATAKAAGARFINLQLSSLVDKWYGESQKRAEAVFSLAVKLQPTIIFIDEIDSLLRSRTSSDHEATGMIKTQFMSLWDGLLTDANCRVMVMGATNRPQDVDHAILRRMPCTFYVGPPSVEQRRKILEVILRHEQVATDVDLQTLAENLDGFNGSDIKEMCRTAALNRVRSIVADGDISEGNCELSDTDLFKDAECGADWRCITRQDFEQAIRKMKKTRCMPFSTLMSNLPLD